MARHAHQRLAAAAGLAVLLLACGSLGADAAGASTGSGRGGRRLKQLTTFYSTPAAAGSRSLGLDGGLALRPDGTVHAAGGAAVSAANALANPLLNALTLGGYKNQPQAASTAYTQIPLLLEQTIFPTLGYGLAEATGDLASGSAGGWGSAEFGYNPLSNNLGTSVSAGTTNSVNLGASERVGEINPAGGFSGVEFAGFANDLTNLADARTDQSGQAIAYPYNILSPLNPLTCTQALLFAVTLTGYDVGAPAAPLPRDAPPGLIPSCLAFFNFGTLDDFTSFVDERGAGGNNGSKRRESFFDNNRDGRIAGLARYFPGGRVFNTTGRADLGGGVENATTTVGGLSAPPVGVDAANRAAAAALGRGGAAGADAGAGTGGGPAAAVRAGGAGAGAGRGGGRNGGRGGGRNGGGDGDGEPLPAGVSPARTEALSSGDSASDRQRVQPPPKDFADALRQAVSNASPEVRALASTPLGQALLERASTGALAAAADGATAALANITASALGHWAPSLREVSGAATNLTSGLALNASNVAVKAAIASIEAAEPLIAAGVGARDAVLQPAAAAARQAGARLAREGAARLARQAAALPAGEERQQLEALAAEVAAGARSAAAAAAGSRQQQQQQKQKQKQQPKAQGRRPRQQAATGLRRLLF